MFRILFILSLFFSLSKQCVAQYLTVGTGGVFNTSIVQVGFDFRAGIEKKRWGLFADYYHYGVGKGVHDFPINEYYLTLNGRFSFIKREHFNMYLSCGYLYTEWINETELGPGIYHGVNAGVGFEYKFSSYAAFAEINTNSVWLEPNCHIGIKKYLPMHNVFRDGLHKRYNLNLQDNKE